VQPKSEGFDSYFQKEQFLISWRISEVIGITSYSSFLVMSIAFDLRKM